MISIYSSFFNVEKMSFPWRETLKNWLTFLDGRGEIAIAANTSMDNTPELVENFFKKFKEDNFNNGTVTKVVRTEISYEDPAFDGKIKAAALAACSQPFCTLLDCDERLVPQQRGQWFKLTRELEKNLSIDAIMVPVVDAFQDESHYMCGGQSLVQKWYLHRNSPNITRGVVRWAYRENGSIDIKKSDSCELIYKDSGELVRAAGLLAPLPHFMQVSALSSGEVPFVWHLGYLDKQQRIKQDEFWQPVWQNRDKSDVKTAKKIDELEKIQYYPHRLLSWKTN